MLKPPFKVRAKYGWSGQTKGDLGFLEGDILNVSKVTGDWYYGTLLRNKKSSGYFPNNYVVIVDSPQSNAMINQDDEKPVLPPIPSRETHSKHHPNRSQMEHPQLPPIPKTLASKQLPTFYKENQTFYDGYVPRSGSSTTTPTTSTTHSTPLSEHIFDNSQYISDSIGNASFDISGVSRFNNESSVTSSENSFAIMSDFSATSAGSLARHRYAQSFESSVPSSLAGSTPASSTNNKKRYSVPTGSSNIFSKLVIRSNNNSSMELPKLPDIQKLAVSNSHSDAADWLTVNSHINRSRTLTKYEKHPRYMRALQNNRDLVLHPQDAVYNGLNTNETMLKLGQAPTMDIRLKDLNIEYIDAMTRKRCSHFLNTTNFESWVTTIFSARYSTTLAKLRGIYVFLTEFFQLIDDHGQTNFNEPVSTDCLSKILFSGKHRRNCTPYELTSLFKKMANCLQIECEIVIGFLKTPPANSQDITWDYKFNHCWLRVLIHKEWRFVDVILGNITNPIHEFVNNRKAEQSDMSFFLVEPLHFIFTHIPPREFEQHIVPSVDPLSALYLPLTFPSFFTNDIKLYKFSTALSFLEDSEIYECSLEVPNDIEVFASTIIPNENTHANKELALVQVKKQKPETGRRIVIIKAVLPPGASQGNLYIHSGLRGSKKGQNITHPLSLIIPLYHKGKEMHFEFVVKKRSENLQKLELYVLEPQNRFLFHNNDYNFEILQHPFDGIMYNERHSMAKNKKQPMKICSPSGKTYDLQKVDPHFPYGTWKVKVKVREQGVWTAHVLADSGIGWCEFAEWLCM